MKISIFCHSEGDSLLPEVIPAQGGHVIQALFL